MEEYVKKHDVQACLEQLAAEHLVGNDFDTFISLPEAQDKIEELTAVEVEPVRYGKWISASTKPGVQIGMKCSLCGARIKYSEFFNGNHNYCHKCGAKMHNDTLKITSFSKLPLNCDKIDIEVVCEDDCKGYAKKSDT